MTEPINKRLEILLSSGIRDHFYSRYADKKYLVIHKDNSPKTLTLSQIQGIFEICGVLYVVAIFVFLVEIVWSRLTL